jgi:hypothetical protein
MASDDPAVRALIERLDRRELNDELKVELKKLTDEQLLRVVRILSERVEMQSSRVTLPLKRSRRR